ncbi:MAG: PEGA domain-containing protein [Kofleriaceae bacterium]
MRALLFACTIVSLAGMREAAGDGAGVIAASTQDRAAVAAAMADAMTARARRVVPDGVAEARAAVAAGAVPVDAMARFRRVRDQVDEGWRAYLRVAVDFAGQRLASARTEAEPLLALAGGNEVYADAALRLAAVMDHLGRKTEAQAVMALALALDPDRPITSTEFSPDVTALVDTVRALPVIPHRVTITSSPAGAAIVVDGKERGQAPLELEVGRGQHVIVARLPRHRPTVRGVVVGEDTAIALALDADIEATRLVGGAALGMPDPAQQELVDATLRYADLDEVVIVAETTRRGGPALLAQRCAGIPARCSAVVEIGFSDRAGLAAAARSAWDAVRAGELRYPASVLNERDGGTRPRRWCEACRSPWLWTGVGAAVVVGTVVTLIVTSASRPPPVVGVNPPDFLPR